MRLSLPASAQTFAANNCKMKLSKQLLSLLLLVVMAAACKKEPVNGPVAVVEKGKLTQVDYEFGQMKIAYNSAGALKEYTISNNGRVVERWTLAHTGSRVDTVSAHGVYYTYHYTGNLLTKVVVYKDGRDPVAAFEYTYNNNLLAERIKYVAVGQPRQLTPYTKLKYTFTADGNLAKTQLIIWMLGSWSAAGEVVTYQYDDKENTYSHLELEPFVPTGLLMKNNPVKIITSSFFGDVNKTVTHNYTYNQFGQPVTRNTLITAVGAADTRSVLTFTYAK
jgi:hypothetical protein